MSVTDVALMDAKTFEQTINDNGQSDLTCTRYYLVTSDSRTESELAVVFATSVPNARDAHPDSSLLRVVSKVPKHSLEDATYKWIVTVQYNSKPKLVHH